MTIKEISEKYHITADTLRYYERVGMIPPVTRTASGIRDYGPKDESWVSLAICMRKAGLPVEAIGLIMGIDRILDMTRTAVNITGDAVCTTIVARQDNAVDVEIFNKMV